LQQSTKISEYLKTVCDQIRWNKAHSVISEEIENHITDQKNAYIAEGLDEETATVKAINEMGDPVLVGTELNRTHRPKMEWSIIALTGCVLLLGFAIRMFLINDYDTPWISTNSIISTLLGIGLMAIAYFLDFTIIGNHSKAIYIGLIVVTIVVMFVSPTINGQYAYVPFLLLLLPTAFAGIIYSMRSKGYLGIILSGMFFVVAVFIGMMIPNFSIVSLYSLNCLILLTLAIAKGWFNVNKFSSMLLVYIPTVITAIVFILITMVSNSYGWLRLQNAIDPSLDPMGAGYIGTITRDIIEGAKFFGQGELALNPGNVLPEIHTNSLLTYLIHEFGWISFIVIMTVILSLIIRSFMLCSRQKSVLGRLVSTSVLITFTTQVALYVAYNLGFQLFSPLTLPLISYGGTATIINMILIGIMLSVFKSGDLVRDHITKRKKNKLLEIVDGKIIINLNTKQ
jgi:cell division protein FtsW (lipid II flippase)